MEDIRVGFGSKIKMGVHLEPFGDIHAESYDFTVYFFTPNGKVELGIVKEALIKEDSDNYIARVDTGIVGLGRLMFRVTASVPDEDFEGGFRDEAIPETKTNVVIVK